MHICLIYPSVEVSDFRTPQLGIYLLSSILRQNDIKVDVYDASHFIQNRNISLTAYDAIGLSTTSLNWCFCKTIISEIKRKYPDLPIILGGVHVSYFDQYVLSSTDADIIIRGEAEKTLVNIIDYLRGKINLKEIAGISYKSSNKSIIRNQDEMLLLSSELSGLPLPAYDLISSGFYATLPVEFSRGCAHNCIFCSSMFREKRRPFSVETIIKYLDSISNKYLEELDIDIISIVDDCFITNRSRLREITSYIEDRCKNARFSLETRIDELIKPWALASLLKIDPYEIVVGVESGYNEGLLRIGKKITIEATLHCAEEINKHSLDETTIFSFIIGFPWENYDNCLKTLDFAKTISDRYGIGAAINWWIPVPSQLWYQLREYDCYLDEAIYDKPGWQYDLNIFSKIQANLSMHDVVKIQKYFNKYVKSSMVHLARMDRTFNENEQHSLRQAQSKFITLLN